MSDGLEFEEEYDESAPPQHEVATIVPEKASSTDVATPAPEIITENEKKEEKEQETPNDSSIVVVEKPQIEKEIAQQPMKKKEEEALEFEDETFEIEEEKPKISQKEQKKDNSPQTKKEKAVEDLIQEENSEDHPNEEIEKILEEEMDEMPATDLVLQTKGDKFSKISPLFSPFLDKQAVTYDEFLDLIVSDQK